MKSTFRPLATRAASVALMLGAAATLSACSSEGDLVLQEGVGVSAIRSKCPAVGIPAYTGDITLFRDAANKTMGSMDLTASITDLRTTCDETGAKIYSESTFQVYARRTDTSAARTVDLPYFVTVLQGGSSVQTKRVGTVTLNFAAGEERAQASAKAGAFVDAAAATLPDDIRERVTRKRRPGDADAAMDPLAAPDVKAAIARASFEVLVGFQLDQDQLAYNATR